VGAWSVADRTTLGLVPGADLRGTDGRPFRVPLSNPIYVAIYDEARTLRTSALVAQGPAQPVWMHAPTCSLLMHRRRQAPFVAALFVAGQDRGVLCQLEPDETAFHLPGLIVDPQRASEATVLFTWKPIPGPLPPRTVLVEIDAGSAAAIVRIPAGLSTAGITTSVVRRDDFLSLGFEFRDLAFEGQGPKGTFVPPGPDAPHLVVVLPPQNVGERAIFEADASYPVADSPAPRRPPPRRPRAPPPRPPPPPGSAPPRRPARPCSRRRAGSPSACPPARTRSRYRPRSCSTGIASRRRSRPPRCRGPWGSHAATRP